MLDANASLILSNVMYPKYPSKMQIKINNLQYACEKNSLLFLQLSRDSTPLQAIIGAECNILGNLSRQ